MRHYPIDSPQAAARILALAILADGGLDVSELRVINNYDIDDKFGLDPVLLDDVIKDFCFDLAQYSDRDFASHLELDRDTIGQLLRDIRDPKMQMDLLRMMVDIVNADGSLAGGEAVLVSEAMMVWGLDLHQVAGSQRIRPPENARRRGIGDRRQRAPQIG
jgi:uncharacterized tellurite resistance protein B-like protein